MNKIALLFSLSVLLGSTISCNSKKEEKIALEKYSITKPIVVDTTYTNEYVADIQSLQNVEIRTKINGYIEKIHIDEGKPVKAGQLLFSINSQSLQKEVLKAKAMVKSALADAKNAELDLQNVKILANNNVVSKTELEKAQATYAAALARIEEHRAHEASAAIQLSMTQIRAPFDGIINRIPFKTGSLINEGTLLTTISNNRSVYAYFNVSEKEYLQFKAKNSTKKQDDITLLLADNKPHQHKGTIETIEGEFDQNTGNIAFRAKFPNPELLLKHGSSGKIQLTNTLNNALIIPQKATFEIQDKQYVFVVDKNNTVRARNIEISQRIPHLYVIASGLSASDNIIYEGIQSLKDGDKITPQLVAMQQLISKL
ncbi:efflux RND transporter periplasmic adaptor subunit [Flavobacterium granuli]|uniref:Membrane fusion protein (Multidrug efflux system) n=1 Tax=Flavobacterium granuli TaxID=280093 RepID=A0A1M5IDI1_9FLAO|nr:efflux RND transporter periplasmic adaptor subunit [Flavobacterium granuli]PRZ27923.1 membrane fusion protein (multidrug efflux system) [Flavobacterium granuli]SHG26438.1 membrane fusion protein, multidrug efflux system [Flavobacterium granuli]